MDRITIEQILDPITPEKFFKEYWNKKHLVIRRNNFKNLYGRVGYPKVLSYSLDRKLKHILGSLSNTH